MAAQLPVLLQHCRLRASRPACSCATISYASWRHGGQHCVKLFSQKALDIKATPLVLIQNHRSAGLPGAGTRVLAILEMPVYPKTQKFLVLCDTFFGARSVRFPAI